MLPYPTSLPLDEITLLVASIRKGDILADKPRLAKAVWELAGYASLMALGEPSAVLTPSPAAEPISPIHMAQSGPAAQRRAGPRIPRTVPRAPGQGCRCGGGPPVERHSQVGLDPLARSPLTCVASFWLR
jgi:hypothetical protein